MIPFNLPYITGNEISYISDALASGSHAGNYNYNNRVKDLIFQKYGLEGVFLTPSCTAALEMGALLANIQLGDEVILPSFTFSSTANAILIFGAKPVFCEIRPSDMNIDVSQIEKLITPRTKMIIPIDYAGVPCDIDEIMIIAEKYNLTVMQDCAQSYGSLYKGEISGEKAHLACYSFHDTKNFSCGEGGALVVNKPEWRERAEYMAEKGTDRTKVIDGLQNKYSWIEKGSSYLLSDILAAMLLAQLEKEEEIKEKRKIIYDTYLSKLKKYESQGYFVIQHFEEYKKTNYHCFWLIFNSNRERELFIDLMKRKGIAAYSSYVPLHSSKMGLQLGYKKNDLPLTEDLAGRLVRLPLYPNLKTEDLESVIKATEEVLNEFKAA
ncbi:dTDP-4-amino-4,6-dideoxygalactose transaminase [Salegentibacter holothuriorum]|uniref:dTDP-4-amino-4,6-dideoxygalactose transaminase n=1 Tax=Salegentibacter holothuriorum TaxID=241145 RepID=A0A1T5APW5_9FLAO|nr:dTDP-4-amino-4,6-dideoxygalactose transaminase [Salegentibacter holothuriorum]SKB37091.1 dTDP-4-amino-4,6-dideoxygalactose transaminase [Salegentibacter holothuriorum]